MSAVRVGSLDSAAVCACALLAAACVPAAQAASVAPPAAPATAAVSSAASEAPAPEPTSPHALALTRHLSEPWAHQTDKDGQLAVPLVDAGKWKRVRYWAVDHFVGFKYGDDLTALNVVMVFPLSQGEESNPRVCMRIAERWGRARIRDFQVELGKVSEQVVRWQGERILVHRADAEVVLGFATKRFSAAWAGYPAYDSACLLFAQAVPWDGEPALAKAVLDRWVDEGVGKLKLLSEQPPQRR